MESPDKRPTYQCYRCGLDFIGRHAPSILAYHMAIHAIDDTDNPDIPDQDPR